jgi:hypothetical protein
MGMVDWIVDGVDQMFQQWFWFRVGPSGGENALDTLGAPTVTTSARTAELSYAGGGLLVDVFYLLTGGNPGTHVSDIAETISVENTSTAPIDFHFFQYTDLDLNGTAGGDSLRFTNPNAVQQVDSIMQFSETVVTPPPSHHEGDFFPVTLAELSDGSATTLSDLPPIGTLIGPGDVTWAYQWDVTVLPGDTFIISKDKQVNLGVPEASSLVSWSLIGLAAGCIVYVNRRKVQLLLG